MSTYEPQVGDIVRYQFEVEAVTGDYGWASIMVDGNPLYFSPEELTLVSRPEPTYPVELTAYELEYFWNNGLLSYVSPRILTQFSEARKAAGLS